MLAKIFAIAVAIWFYQTAQKIGEKPLYWAVIGVIGFWLTAFIVHYVVTVPLLTVFKTGFVSVAVRQLPALVGFAATYLIRGKFLLKNAATSVMTDKPEA